MVEFDHAYLHRVRRDARAAQFTESFRKPGHHTYELMIDAGDEDALAIAIERSTPDELARWIIGLVTGAGAFEDDLADEDGEDVYDDSDGIPF
jgi:hypothetical protein